MPRGVLDSARARGALAVDPKTLEEGASWPERVLAWDEDATTLAIDAASALAAAAVAVVGPGIDAETFRVALDVPRVFAADDPMGVAKGMTGNVLAVGCPPGTSSAVAALVGEAAGPEPAAPRDVSPAPRMVSSMRALQESRAVPPAEEMPDAPMGAYVPWGTWNEDLPARLRLVGQRCAACGRAIYPPRGACPACRGTAFAPLPLPRDARVYTATRIGRGGAPSEFALEQAQVGAYWVGVVEWPEQDVRVIARLAGFDESGPSIGQPVRALVRRLFVQEGKARYGVKFGPAP
ncbi:MAG TPA: zinc ribbon domain-containing protein [Candidatus Thermoplasmatota archaeon]|nr:zinc ribbon domain-containing protein [Candidatus Thermoplasmatota archaeon]